MSEDRIATYLADLGITESSGVDFPAHLTDGWMVMKAREPLPDAALAAALTGAEALAKRVATESARKPSASIATSPANESSPTTKSGSHRTDHADSLRAGAEKDTADVTKSNEELATENEALRKQLADALAKDKGEANMYAKDGAPKSPKSADEEDKDGVTDYDGNSDDAPTAKAITKALEDFDMPEVVRKLLVNTHERALDAEKVAKAERERRVTAEWIEKAKEFRALSAKADDLGSVLKSINDSSPANAAKVMEVLKAASAALRTSALFGEVGSSASPEAAGSYQTVEQMAKSLASEEKIPFHKALERVIATPEGREAAEQYRNDLNGAR